MTHRVRNWSKHQHYKDRNPPWIKLHFELLSSRDWVMWDDASRALAVAIMLLASRSGGEIDLSPAGIDYLTRVAYLRSPPNVQPLVTTGFLEPLADASAMLADARPETEAEAETEAETTRSFRARDAVGWVALDSAQRLALAGLYGLEGATGTQEGIFPAGADEAERMRLVETALLQLQAEGHEGNIRGSFFRKVLERVIANEPVNAGILPDGSSIWDKVPGDIGYEGD